MTDCLITGVVLVEGDRMFNGDLFIQRDTYIVNCNEASEAAADVTEETKWVSPVGDYWHRRGVYVIPMDQLDFSRAAMEYMR